MAKSNSNNNRCGGCPYYYGEPDWCMYGENDVPDNLKKKCEQGEMNKLGDLKNWNEVTRGLYRYVVAASVCYEMHIMYHAHSTDILTANAQLYIVGKWRDKNQTFFERDLLFIGPVSACLEQVIKEHEEDMRR